MPALYTRSRCPRLGKAADRSHLAAASVTCLQRSGTLAAQDGPTILVGHSYGGAVITEAGNHRKVLGLAYIAAFAPDKGESVATLNKHAAPGTAVSPILPPQDGYLFQAYKDALLEAVYLTEVEKLAAAEPKFDEAMPLIEALRAWMMLFFDYIATKQIIALALNTLIGGSSKVLEA
jgi:pimeloyl-ACP methyl ester carboxylesterase